jgi:regulator of replication initiation timing
LDATGLLENELKLARQDISALETSVASLTAENQSMRDNADKEMETLKYSLQAEIESWQTQYIKCKTDLDHVAEFRSRQVPPIAFVLMQGGYGEGN